MASSQIPFFLLIGQSNMAGRGNLSDLPESSRAPDDRILMFRNSWMTAAEPIHDPDDPVFSVKADRGGGVGPGMAFAQRLLGQFASVGLVMCARGGTGIEGWSPDAGAGLMREALRRKNEAVTAGGRFVGIVAAIGEGDTSSEEAAAAWQYRFRALIHGLRESTAYPVVYSQIGAISDERRTRREHGYRAWERLQEIQEETHIANSAMIRTADLPLNADGLHLSTDGQIRAGKRFADAALNLLGQTGSTRE